MFEGLTGRLELAGIARSTRLDEPMRFFTKTVYSLLSSWEPIFMHQKWIYQILAAREETKD